MESNTDKLINGFNEKAVKCFSRGNYVDAIKYFNEVLKLDVDPASHPAWTGGNAQIRENAGQVARFKKKFGNIKV